MFNEEEVFFQCPYCMQNVSMLFEQLYGEQSYIEDCEVCCNPIQVRYKIEDGELVYFEAERTDV